MLFMRGVLQMKEKTEISDFALLPKFPVLQALVISEVPQLSL